MTGATETLLNTEIDLKLAKLRDMDPATKEYAAVVDNLSKLMDRRIELEKIAESAAQNELKMKQEKKDRVVSNVIDVGKIVLPLAVTVWGACVSLKFEETGTITTAVGRKFMDKLLGSKK